MAEASKAVPHPVRAPRVLYRPFKGNCERCGQEYQVERGGAFGDRDYYEVFHERQELEEILKLRTREAMEYAYLGSRLARTVLDQAREIERLRTLLK